MRLENTFNIISFHLRPFTYSMLYIFDLLIVNMIIENCKCNI
jgi:hypothetical protein